MAFVPVAEMALTWLCVGFAAAALTLSAAPAGSLMPFVVVSALVELSILR